MTRWLVLALCGLACGSKSAPVVIGEDITAADRLVSRASQTAERLALLEAMTVATEADRLALAPDARGALASTGAERTMKARLAFMKFVADLRSDRPDIIALVDTTGDVVAMHEVQAVAPKMWRDDKPGSNRPTVIPALDAALASGATIGEPWTFTGAQFVVGAAPVVGEDGKRAGAIVIARARTAKHAEMMRAMIGVEVAFVDGAQVAAHSFTRADIEPDLGKQAALVAELPKLAAGKQKIRLDGADHLAMRVAAPRWSPTVLPADLPPVTAAVVVLAPTAPASPASSVPDDKALVAAYQLVQRLETIEMLELARVARGLAAEPELAGALRREGDRAAVVRPVLAKFAKPATVLVALTDAQGEVVASHAPPPFTWSAKANKLWPLDVALGAPVDVADMFVTTTGMFRVATSPVIDHEAPTSPGSDALVIGAVVVATAIDTVHAKRTAELLGVEVAYLDGTRVVATSLGAIAPELGTVTGEVKQPITIGGIKYTAARVKLPRQATRRLPESYPPQTAAVVVLAPATSPPQLQ